MRIVGLSALCAMAVAIGLALPAPAHAVPVAGTFSDSLIVYDPQGNIAAAAYAFEENESAF